MDVSEKQDEQIGLEEEKRWKKVYQSILKELSRSKTDWNKDRHIARELTSEIVAATRDEDKMALASDEAVAHGLSKLRKEKTKGLDSLLEQPYFARVVTNEDGKKVEFRLSTASLPSERIIDWRKAPISKLYYNYKQGDEFSETIQGRDREGVIELRRSFHGIRDSLNIIELPHQTLNRINGQWKISKEDQYLSRNIGQDGHLPPILSLITPEQFELITQNSTDPVIVQGIAGSGKTTVALHRLAWLLHEGNSTAQAKNCLVIMLNPALKAYVENTLPELQVHGVAIRTYHQWLQTLTEDCVGIQPHQDFQQSLEYAQFKSSALCLKFLSDYVPQTSHQWHEPQGKPWTQNSVASHGVLTRQGSSPEPTSVGDNNHLEDLFLFFEYLKKQTIPWPKSDEIKTQLAHQIENKICHPHDDSLILHLLYTRLGHYPSTQNSSLGELDHLVIDEVQDFGLIEIRALLNALNKNCTATLVGDLAQKIHFGRHFSSWEEMLKDAGFKNTTPISLTVSHRSTQEIMDIASEIRSDISVTSSALTAIRHGPIPAFIHADHSQVLPNLVGKWIQERLEESRHCLCGIICRHVKSAKRLVDILHKLGHHSVRWGHEDHFDFSPGVIVTTVEETKGLEFRNVLIVEPSEYNYSSKKEVDINLLYIAVTRAEVRLDFIGCEKPTFLLPDLPTY